MTFIAMPWTGLKLVTQSVSLTSGFWESGNPGWYNLQSGINMVVKDLNYVLEVDSVYLTSGPTSLSTTANVIKPVTVTSFGQKYFASGTLSNVSSARIGVCFGQSRKWSCHRFWNHRVVNAIGF